VPLLKRLLNGPLGAVIVWAFIFAITFAVGVVGHWLVFSGGHFPDSSVVSRWSILWVAYFWIGHSVGEHSTRWLANRLRP
jgi:cytochrome b